ncbi:F5/8_type C domain-containing protein [Hexamita inflata]|uniref:F5/8 type C domain-containing protein n=1 Tax=Hexamita inflata TaxID=28002 RepID=A0AA86PLW2_9EUKA|nr:F5/8 type C domain-containing protein [Hexamita inflata]
MAELVSEVNSSRKAFQLSEELKYVTRTVSNCINTHFDVSSSYLGFDGKNEIGKCWVPLNSDKITGQFIEFDFHKQVLVGLIITKGCSYYCECWVTKYKVEYFNEGQWCQGGEFNGNTDGETKVFRRACIIAEKLRIIPIEFYGAIKLNADLSISEDLTQVDNIPNADEAYKNAIMDTYNRTMIEIFEQNEQQYFDLLYKISVYNLSNEDKSKLISTNLDGKLIILIHIYLRFYLNVLPLLGQSLRRNVKNLINISSKNYYRIMSFNTLHQADELFMENCQRNWAFQSNQKLNTSNLKIVKTQILFKILVQNFCMLINANYKTVKEYKIGNSSKSSIYQTIYWQIYISSKD